MTSKPYSPEQDPLRQLTGLYIAHNRKQLGDLSRFTISVGIAVWPNAIVRFMHLEREDHEFAELDWEDFICYFEIANASEWWCEHVVNVKFVGGGCPFYYLPDVVWMYKRFVPDGEQAWYPTDHPALPAGPSAGPPETWEPYTDAKYFSPPEPEPVPLGPEPLPEPFGPEPPPKPLCLPERDMTLEERLAYFFMTADHNALYHHNRTTKPPAENDHN